MAKLQEVYVEHEPELREFMFHCPGCGSDHIINVSGKNSMGACWGWNGSMDSPTFTPSLKVQWNYGEGQERKHHCCHSFITNGVMSFCADTTHALSGKSAPIPEWSEDDEFIHRRKEAE